jgi:hypothetical protein
MALFEEFEQIFQKVPNFSIEKPPRDLKVALINFLGQRSPENISPNHFHHS